jgi:hypothetical protein
MKTRGWSPHAPVPFRAHTMRAKGGGTMLRIDPHKDYEDVDDGDAGADT